MLVECVDDAVYVAFETCTAQDCGGNYLWVSVCGGIHVLDKHSASVLLGGVKFHLA